MKIVITVEEFDPNKGYLEYYLAKEFTKLGHKIIIITFDKINEPFQKIIEGFKVIYLPFYIKLNGYHFPSLSAIFFLYQVIKQEKPDIIHGQPIFSPLFILINNHYCSNKFKMVGTILSQIPMEKSFSKKILSLFVKILINNYIINKCGIIFVKTKHLLKIQIKRYNIPINRYKIIPLGADENLFKFSLKNRLFIRDKLGLFNKDILIVYSGKIYPKKRLDILIKAISPIINKDKSIKILIIGKGNPTYINYLKTISNELKVYNNIIFYPWVHRTKLPELYSASDIAVWPGLSSISIIEAASIGLPLIIEKSPVEIYGLEYGNGFSYEHGNIEELRNYLEIIIYNDKLRHNMGNKSRLLVKEKLNWTTIASQYLDAYKYARAHETGLYR